MIKTGSKILFCGMIGVLFFCFAQNAFSWSTFGGVVIALCFALMLYRTTQESSTSTAGKGIAFVLALFLVGLLAFGIGFSVEPAWDFGRVYGGALDITTNGRITDTLPYFLESYNNFFVTWMLSFCFQIASLVQLTPLYAGIVLNCLAIWSSIALLTYLIWVRYTPQQAFFFALCASLCLPLYTYAPIFYTDTLSMPCISIALFLWHRLDEVLHNSKSTPVLVLHGILLGITAYVGYRLKASVGILFIALVLLQCFPMRKKAVFALVSAMATIALCFGGYQLALKNTGVIDTSAIDDYRLPAEHYVMIGLIGNGGYNPDDHQFSANITNITARKAAEIAVIKARLENYGVAGYANFLKGKITFTWLDGTYYAPYKLSIDPLRHGSFHDVFLSDGAYFTGYQQVALSLQLSMLLLMLASVLCKDPLVAIGRFSVFGLFAFLLIWETRSRYLVNYLPIFLFLAQQGCTGLTTLCKRSSHKNKRR